MSEIDELILASRALAHAASQVISLEEVPSRIVHEFYQAVRVQQEASKARADSALDRASIPAMFNVVGDELAKLTRVNELILDRLRVLSAQGSVNCEKIDSIEAQLAALRAEADKGRAALEQAVKEPLRFLVNGIMSLHDEHKELQRWIEGINKAVHIPLNRENAERQQRQSEQLLANMKISKICPQCGQPYRASACGPTHAIVWSEMKRRRAARKKKQERKLGARKSR